MKGFSRFFLPLLTVLTLFGSVFLPPRLSLLLDAGRFGSAHTEALAGDGRLTLQGATLARRLQLLAAVAESIPDGYQVLTREITEAEDFERVKELALEQLLTFQEQGFLSRDILLDEIDYFGYAVQIWDQADQTWASFWAVTVVCDPYEWGCDMVLDQATGLPLRIELGFSAGFWENMEVDWPVFGAWYFDFLGLEVPNFSDPQVLTASDRAATFTLPDLGVACRAYATEGIVSVIPYLTDPEVSRVPVVEGAAG